MSEKPILFSGPMVKAILDGRKTMTRRVLKPKKYACLISDGWADEYVLDPGNAEWLVQYLKFMIGDLLWVREEFSGPWAVTGRPPSQWSTIDPIWYWADGNPEDGDWTKPKPSIHMPRWASRISLRVTAVKVERLQDISEDDAEAEGCDFFGDQTLAYKGKFAALWAEIHGPGAWDANPWVAAYSFERVKP